MKALILSLAAILAVVFVSHVASADDRPPRDVDHGSYEPTPSTPGNYGSGDITHWERPSRDVDHGSDDNDCCSSSSSYDSGTYASSTWYIACAPNELQSNVVATDKALKALAATSQFANAAKFKKAVADIGAMKDPAARGEAYMNLAGINTKDAKAVAEFVGARDARGTWIVELQRHTELSEAQAVSVAQSLQGALRGGLQ